MENTTESTDYGSIEQLSREPTNDSAVEKSIESSEKRSILSCCRDSFLKLKLEIFTFLFTFSFVLTKVTSTTMITEKVCLVHFGYNASICNDLDNHTGIKSSVVKLSSNYQLAHTLIQTAPAALLACFIGPWSDHYGRKFPIILGIFGMLLDSAGSAICAHFLETRVEYYFIPAVFTGLTGGSVTITAVIYSFASDCSTLFARTMKYAFIEMSVGFATSLGSTAGGWIYKEIGFISVFLFSAGGLLVSVAFGIFLIKETRGLENKDSWPFKLRRLASCAMFVEGFSAIAKQRPYRDRRQVILLIISMCFITITMNSTGDINYLYAQYLFNWDNTKYSNITAIYAVVGIAVLIVIIPLLKHFRITDPYLGLLGTISLVGKSLGVGLSRNQAIYHIANVAGFLGGCARFAARSRISKVACQDDLGKMFTFVSSGESLLPILTSTLMSQLFVACLDFFPGMPYITLGIFLLLPLGVFSWMIYLPKISYEDVSRKTQLEGVLHTDAELKK